jgi:hypothetical protein
MRLCSFAVFYRRFRAKEISPAFRATSLGFFIAQPLQTRESENEDVSDLTWLPGTANARYRFLSSANDLGLLTSLS